MEFRAQDHHPHNSDQMRSTSATATATSSLGFNTSSHNLTKPDHHHHQSSGGAERRRSSSSISNTHNGNSTPTGLIINTTNIATNTSNNCTNATQTLDQNFQPTPRPFQAAPLPSRDPEITTPSGGAKPKTASSSSSASVKYKECLKNHAASVGGSVFDGCGEFMASGEEGSLEALKCAACQCHRNFHRKEVDGEQLLYSPGSRRSSTNVTTNALMLNPIQLTPPLALPSPTGLHHLHHHHHHNPHHPHHHHHHHKYPIVQPMNVAYGGGGGGNESSSEELNAGYGGSADNSAPPYQHHLQTGSFGMSKKRHRTKFTQEQKDRMLEFAERVGWRMQKQDEEEVERFCADVGVKRQVLKVWMHNNKSTNVNKTAKQQLDHVNVMMGNLGNTLSSAANDDANMIGQVSASHDQLEEGELDT